MYDLYSDFDMEQHKQHYVNYLEVILFPDGHIEYAVPSHQEKLISVACKKLNVSRQELFDMCPQDYFFDVLVWLCNITGCVSIWNEGLVKSDCLDFTQEQLQTLLSLINNGLYGGDYK